LQTLGKEERILLKVGHPILVKEGLNHRSEWLKAIEHLVVLRAELCGVQDSQHA
jgi:hypothetical protein